MANRDILAIGTSAGGVDALRILAKNLQSDLPASVLLTIHLPSHARSALDDVLSSAGALPAQFAQDGEKLRKSRIYIAPPDRHLIVDGDRLSLGEGARKRAAGARGAGGACAEALRSGEDQRPPPARPELGGKAQRISNRDGYHPRFDPPHGPPRGAGGYGEKERGRIALWSEFCDAAATRHRESPAKALSLRADTIAAFDL